MTNSPLTSTPTSSKRPGAAKYLILIALGAILVVGALIGLRAVTTSSSAAHTAAMPTNPTIEDQYGIRINMVGATADGGLVDFRFVVVDPDKALAMLQDESKLPVMVAEDSGTLVNSATLMIAKHDLNPGGTYFLLYRNTQGAIKHGTPVTVKFGDLKLEHVIAQ
jgi:hypothetical protein